MKILFVGDYSNLHATLAEELKRKGHTAHVISDRGLYLGSHADFPLLRKPGMTGAVKYLADIMTLLPGLRGYDVVQLINPGFLDLRPGKLKFIFDFLRRHNGAIHLTLAGDDHFFIKSCVEGAFRFSEMRVGDHPTPFAKAHPEKITQWLAPQLADYTRHVYQNVDGAVAILPEYHIAAQHAGCRNLTYIPLHIDVESLPFAKPEFNGKIRIMVGIRRGNLRELQKGSLELAETALRLQKEFPDKCEAVIVENRPLAEYLRLLNSSHIILDQLYAYSPATNALQSMAMGKLAGSGAQPEYYEYIAEPDRKGILSLSPTDSGWIDELKEIISNPEVLVSRGEEARRLVEAHHDVRTAATQYLDFWTCRR